MKRNKNSKYNIDPEPGAMKRSFPGKIMTNIIYDDSEYFKLKEEIIKCKENFNYWKDNYCKYNNE